MKNSAVSLAEGIIEGYRIKRGDDLSIFLEAPLAELSAGAHRLQEEWRIWEFTFSC